MGWGEGSGQTVGRERTLLLAAASTGGLRRLTHGDPQEETRGSGRGPLGAEASYSPRAGEPDAAVRVFTPSRLSLRISVSLLESLLLGTCVFMSQIVTASGLPSEAPHQLRSLPPPTSTPAFAFQPEGHRLDSRRFSRTERQAAPEGKPFLL